MRKRIIPVSVLTLVLVLRCFAFAAAETDFSAMTDDEIISSIRQVCNELALRSADEEAIIYEDARNAIRVTLEKIVFTSYNELTFYGTLINESDKNVKVSAEDIYVNNWRCGQTNYYLSAEAGRNDKGVIAETWKLYEKATVSQKEEIILIEVKYAITIDGSKEYLTIAYTVNEIAD